MIIFLNLISLFLKLTRRFADGDREPNLDDMSVFSLIIKLLLPLFLSIFFPLFLNLTYFAYFPEVTFFDFLIYGFQSLLKAFLTFVTNFFETIASISIAAAEKHKTKTVHPNIL